VSQRTPPPPPGFVIQQASSAPPPLPAGFVLESEAPQPEAPSTLSQFGRAGGILARDVLEGGGSLVGLLTDPIVYGAGSATGQNFAGMKDTATQLADAIGLPKPETGTEQVVSRVQQALTGGAGTLSLARGLAG
jgi:hypothetical protein